MVESALYNALSPERKRVVDVTVKDFRTSGVGLEPAARARFNVRNLFSSMMIPGFLAREMQV